MRSNTCIYCGADFQSATWQRKICDDCYEVLYMSPKTEEKKRRKNNPNQRLIDDVREAAKLGLSYGTYKGGTYAR